MHAIYQIRTMVDHRLGMYLHVGDCDFLAQKQTIISTFANHAEVIALHEASCECVWLRSMTKHIRASNGLPTVDDPITLHEDNDACVSQMKQEFVKSDRTKHIPPRFFSFTQVLEKKNIVNIQYICSRENSSDLFTKHFLLPFSKNMFMALRCANYKIYEEMHLC